MAELIADLFVSLDGLARGEAVFSNTISESLSWANTRLDEYRPVPAGPGMPGRPGNRAAGDGRGAEHR